MWELGISIAMVVVGGEGAKREHSEGIRIRKEKSDSGLSKQVCAS